MNKDPRAEKADKNDDRLLWRLLGDKSSHAMYHKRCAYKRMMEYRDILNDKKESADA